MLTITGFCEVVHLGPGLPSSQEMIVMDTNGARYNIPVGQETVRALLRVVVGGRSTGEVDVVTQDDVLVDNAPDIGELGALDIDDTKSPVVEPVRRPKQAQLPIPKFVQVDDEDGTQI